MITVFSASAIDTQGDWNAIISTSSVEGAESCLTDTV